jgi:hypothetical protein
MSIMRTPVMSRTAPATVNPTKARIRPVVIEPDSTAQPSHAGHMPATDPYLTRFALSA